MFAVLPLGRAFSQPTISLTSSSPVAALSSATLAKVAQEMPSSPSSGDRSRYCCSRCVGVMVRYCSHVDSTWVSNLAHSDSALELSLKPVLQTIQSSALLRVNVNAAPPSILSDLLLLCSFLSGSMPRSKRRSTKPFLHTSCRCCGGC